MLLQISIESPLPSERFAAVVETEGGGREPILIEDGWFEGEVSGRALRLKCVFESEAGARPSTTRRPAEGARERRERLPVDVMHLFHPGIDVPADGRLDIDVLWLAPCDGVPDAAPEGTRFGSYEHTLCAARIGLTEDGRELQIGAIRAGFDDKTELDVGGKSLRFGSIIAMAGDFYAHLDDQAARDFAWAWPPMSGITGWLGGDYRAMTLVGDSQSSVEGLHDHIHREATGSQVGALATAIDAAESKHPMRRYLALASQNICHFACQNAGYSQVGNPALALYRAYHRRAVEEARRAGEAGDRTALHAALVVDAFGCHFLTDLFASGHIRTPRDVLGQRFGITIGALVMSKRIHDEDNRDGLWVTTMNPAEGERRTGAAGTRVVWRAYGDDALESPNAKVHLAQIQESVRRSTAEVFGAYCAAHDGVEPPALPRAEDLVPAPLPPGEGPGPGDVSPDGGAFPDLPANHPPMYKILDDGRVAQRVLGRFVPLELSAPPAPGIVLP